MHRVTLPQSFISGCILATDSGSISPSALSISRASCMRPSAMLFACHDATRCDILHGLPMCKRTRAQSAARAHLRANEAAFRRSRGVARISNPNVSRIAPKSRICRGANNRLRFLDRRVSAYSPFQWNSPTLQTIATLPLFVCDAFICLR